MQVFRVKLFMSLTLVRIEWDTVNRAHLLALRLTKMADALRTKVGIYLVDLRSLINGTVRALRLTNVTIDTFIGNHQRHGTIPRIYGGWQHRRGAARTPRRHLLVSQSHERDSPKQTYTALPVSEIRFRVQDIGVGSCQPTETRIQSQIPHVNHGSRLGHARPLRTASTAR